MTAPLDRSAVLEAREAYDAGLAATRDKRRAAWFPPLLLVLLLALPLIQLTGTNYNYLLHLVLFTAMSTVLASGWNVIGGYAGYMSLGHNVFFAIGGYLAGMIYARTGIGTILLAPLAGLVAAAAGFLIGRVTLKVRGPSFIISSLALVMIFRILFDNFRWVGGAAGVTLPAMDLPVQWIKVPYYYAFVLMAAFTLWASYRIKHSKFGLGLRALSKDEVKAESAGIDTRLYKTLAFAISAFFVGMAGAVWGEYLTYIRPNIFLAILLSVNMVLMCILGGKGTVAGPAVGAVLLTVFNEAFVATLGASEINILATGAVMAAVLMFFPDGVVGTLARARRLPRVLDWD